MFHRVKSEQDSEPKKSQDINTGYRREEPRKLSGNYEQENAPAPTQKQEPLHTRVYEGSQPKAQKGEQNMKQTEETPPQAKYTNNAEEHPIESQNRAYQPSVSHSSGYGTSSYSGASSYSPVHAPETSSGNDRTLTIGRGINLSGEIDACDHLMVEGTVEAALKGAKVLEIAESGTFYGTVEIEEATIAGRFEGDITVSGRLTLKSSGVITGSIAYRQLEVEAGAVIDGRMTPLKGNVDPKSEDLYRAGSEASAMAKTKELASKKGDREPANTESGLFSKAHTSY